MINSTVLTAGALRATHTRVDFREAAVISDTYWGMCGQARRLNTEKDDTFKVLTEDGCYVLKLSNPQERLQELRFEIALHQHVWDHGVNIPVPELIPSTNAQRLVRVIDSAGQVRWARMMRFIAGEPLDSTDASPAEREQVGLALARMSHATRTFIHPAQDRLLAWDVRHLPQLTPLLRGVKNPEHRQMLTEGLRRFSSIERVLARQPLYVLHNDFSKSNIIVDHSLPTFVRAVIDFGDSVRTAVAVNVATALLNQLPATCEVRDTDIFADGRDVLRGYLTESVLSDEQLALIPFLVMGRIIARALLTLSRAAAMPENATYILRNTPQGWGQLRWFLAQSDKQLRVSLSG